LNPPPPRKPLKTTLNTILFLLRFLFRDLYFNSTSDYLKHEALYRNNEGNKRESLFHGHEILNPPPLCKPLKTTLNAIYIFSKNFLLRDLYFNNISDYLRHEVLYRNVEGTKRESLFHGHEILNPLPASPLKQP